MNFKPFYIKTPCLTNEQMSEILDKAVEAGANEYEFHLAFHSEDEIRRAVSSIFFGLIGVNGDNNTYFSNDFGDYGEDAVEITIDQLDAHLGLTDKHPHYDLIVKWAAEPDKWAVICKTINGNNWEEVVCLYWLEEREYKLIPKQHLKAALAFYNEGKRLQVKCHGEWLDVEGEPHFDSIEYRVKPKKVKRWIIAKASALASMMYFDSYASAETATMKDGEFFGGQVIEIEVEA